PDPANARPRAPNSGSTDPTSPAPPPHVISPPLLDALRRRLARKEQTILLLNRRGYASLALCRSCGDVMECPHCSVSMTLHRGRRRMICHHCGHTAPPPRQCARCDSADISFRGLGTEQVERIVLESLPGARVARMDVDTTGGKWSHRDILARVESGAVDILVGTQMIAKGLDFHRVTLVGVINADIGLHLPDFRSCERTFQLLSQVAGRAGRGHLAGEVIIQTYVPDHYVVRAAVAHDYRGFVERELGARTDPNYPPTVRMARILVSSPSQSEALAGAESVAAWLRGRIRKQPEVLGPAPAPIEKLHGRFRWHLLLRGDAAGIGRALQAVADDSPSPAAGIRLSLDRDPLHLM
ncbi:MAG: primosomal protein N', partial [Gemmatimonadota bacterium]|nr:primosomal protein N' [Gemmatimonadota bacterium]